MAACILDILDGEDDAERHGRDPWRCSGPGTATWRRSGAATVSAAAAPLTWRRSGAATVSAAAAPSITIEVVTGELLGGPGSVIIVGAMVRRKPYRSQYRDCGLTAGADRDQTTSCTKALVLVPT
jgi:hypothetical protein